MNPFQEALQNVLNSNNNNNNNNNNFRPVRISAKNDFFGRILPLENQNAWPFAIYQSAWISYTNKDGHVSPLMVTVDTHNQQDELGQLLSSVVSFNRQYNKENPEHKGDAIKISSGRYALRVSTRVTFLGVQMIKSNGGQFVQKSDPNGNPAIESFDMSYSALRELAALLKPEAPYINRDGQPRFNTPFQFITTNETFPVRIHFNQVPNGVGNWSATPNEMYSLPAIPFNYFEKNSDGTYKFIDDVVKEREPLLTSNPKFYQTVLNQVKEAIATQKQNLTQSQTNPYAGDMPFNNAPQGSQDVVQNMTNQPMSNFTQPQNNAPQQPQQAPEQAQPASQPNGQMQQPNASQGTTQAPVQPSNQQPTSSVQQNNQQPTNPVPQNNQSQMPFPDNQTNDNSNANTDIDGLLNGNMSLDEFLKN